MMLWQSLQRIGAVSIYAAIGGLLGLFLGLLLVYPFLQLGFWPGFVRSGAFWTPHIASITTGALAGLGYLKSNAGPNEAAEEKAAGALLSSGNNEDGLIDEGQQNIESIEKNS